MPGLLQSSSLHRPPNEVPLVSQSFDGTDVLWALGLSHGDLLHRPQRGALGYMGLVIGGEISKLTEIKLQHRIRPQPRLHNRPGPKLRSQTSPKLRNLQLRFCGRNMGPNERRARQGDGHLGNAAAYFRVWGLGFRDLAGCEPSWSSSGEVRSQSQLASRHPKWQNPRIRRPRPRASGCPESRREPAPGRGLRLLPAQPTGSLSGISSKTQSTQALKPSCTSGVAGYLGGPAGFGGAACRWQAFRAPGVPSDLWKNPKQAGSADT